ncbi:PASTA domain-containing protein [Polymorphospora rubra]|uniref:PASTA domain-containing protein n=1 Tax=Polymorphospora rubra TaxID=338584 RepID=UPI0033F361CA
MADEPRDGAGTPDRADGAPDQTRPFDPVTADDDGPDAPEGSRGAGQPGDLDATALHGAGPDADRTVALPGGPDRTAPLPGGADRTAPLDGDRAGDVWSGRAGVPPPGAVPRGAVPGQPFEQTEQTGWYDADPGPRRWWMPIVVGVVALLLLAVLGFGIWLILRSADDGRTPITPSPSATTGSPTPSPSPTSAAPTSASPSPSEPETVAVPPVVGLPEDAARQLLDQFGLTYGLEFRDSDEPPGTVIEVQPGVGSEVPPGEQVTLVIAQAAAPTAPPTGSPTPSVTPGG